MNIQKVGDFSFAGNMRVCDKPVKVKETISELQDKQISVKVDISKEGLDALRQKVQEMPGYIDFEKEILESGKLYTDEELRKLLSGHLCRCTGYENILRAVKKVMYSRLGITPDN